jgi:hypothetical protein
MLRAERRRVVPFIGAGLSAEAGVPAADPLARLIAEKANERGVAIDVYPQRRVALVAAAQKRNPLVDHCKGKGTGCAQLAELRPETALEHSGMEVEDALALNERIGANGVIAGRKRRDLDLGAQLSERVGDPALAFVHVHDDLRPPRRGQR